MPRPTVQLALVLFSVAAFVGAVVLTGIGPGRSAPTPSGASVPPSQPIGLVGPGASGSPPSGNVASPVPDVTPTPGPTPSLTDKTFDQRSVLPEDLTGYVWPLRNAWITSRFGPRDFGTFLIIDGVGYHDGLDLATHCGDTVHAAHDGRVLVAGRDFDPYLGYEGHPQDVYDRLERLGRVNALAIAVVIDDGNGYRSLYMHLAEVTVEPGQIVNAGDPIGKEGMTGAATGCHTHFSLIRMDGEWQNVVAHLNKYGYPLLIREHVDPLLVLPWGDPFAPQRLQDHVNPPSPSSSPLPPATPTATPSQPPT